MGGGVGKSTGGVHDGHRRLRNLDGRFLSAHGLHLPREEFRKQGLGRQLIHELRAFGRERKINLIQWQTPVHNVDGIRFYEKMGAHAKDKKRYFLPV